MPFRLDDCKSRSMLATLCCNFLLNFTIGKVFVSDTYIINLGGIYLSLLYVCIYNSGSVSFHFCLN